MTSVGEQIDLLVTDGDDRLDSDDVNVMIDGTRVPATVTPLPRREVDIVVATGVAGDALRRALQGALVEFAMQVLPASDVAIDSADTAAFTSKPELLVQRIRELATDASPTAVVSDAIDAPVVPATDRAVVVVGDQQELRDALGGRQRQINDRDDVVVYPIVVGSRSVHPMLQRLASDSGGRALALDQAAQLTGALDRTADDLFNRYRVQAPLPTGIAGSDLSVQIATPTGASEIMPVSGADRRLHDRGGASLTQASPCVGRSGQRRGWRGGPCDTAGARRPEVDGGCGRSPRADRADDRSGRVGRTRRSRHRARTLPRRASHRSRDRGGRRDTTTDHRPR